MTDDLTLSVDLGTSSVRAALLDRRGSITAFASRSFAQTIPHFGWAEQSAAAWWQATVEAIREVAEQADRPIVAVCTCGQMHGTVLIGAGGALASDSVLLWNDKRSTPEVERWETGRPYDTYAYLTANPATPAWPAFKLQWLRDHAPAAYDAAETVLTPKDFINFRLSGVRATDWSEASASFLTDARSRTWSDELVSALGLNRDLLPPIRNAADIIGAVTAEAARETGLRQGLPVLGGGGDLPLALLGSGAAQAGLASDIAGTSSIATLLRSEPLHDPHVANVAVPNGLWGAFTLIDAGGDAIRWASSAIGNGTTETSAETAAAGSDGLFFLPFLSGERLGPARNSRAQFFGLAATHGKAELNRAVLEGVALALGRQFEHITRHTGRPERFVAAGGGGRSDLWLKIKASVYDTPILVPRVLECGVVGGAILARHAVDGLSLAGAMAEMVSIEREVAPVPEWVETYARAMPVFGRIVAAMAPLYDELDGLAREGGASGHPHP